MLAVGQEPDDALERRAAVFRQVAPLQAVRWRKALFPGHGGRVGFGATQFVFIVTKERSGHRLDLFPAFLGVKVVPELRAMLTDPFRFI